MAEKKSEFVVTDRRRFGTEGEPRPDAPVVEEEKTAPQPAGQATPPAATAPPAKQPTPPPTEQAAQAPAGQASPGPEQEEDPPLTAEEQHEQNETYKASGRKIDEMISAAGKGGQGPLEITFERVVESFYMSALYQMGLIPLDDNEPPKIDIIGARQTIDSLTVLQEKTRGNLTDQEKVMLQKALFDLRMGFIGITNRIASSVPHPGAVPPVDKK